MATFRTTITFVLLAFITAVAAILLIIQMMIGRLATKEADDCLHGCHYRPCDKPAGGADSVAQFAGQNIIDGPVGCRVG